MSVIFTDDLLMEIVKDQWRKTVCCAFNGPLLSILHVLLLPVWRLCLVGRVHGLLAEAFLLLCLQRNLQLGCIAKHSVTCMQRKTLSILSPFLHPFLNYRWWCRETGGCSLAQLPGPTCLLEGWMPAWAVQKHHSSREMPSLRKHHSTKEDIIIETLFIKLFVLV